MLRLQDVDGALRLAVLLAKLDGPSPFLGREAASGPMSPSACFTQVSSGSAPNPSWWATRVVTPWSAGSACLSLSTYARRGSSAQEGTGSMVVSAPP
jgi:hypothetical protein